jgi:hypothetical protein
MSTVFQSACDAGMRRVQDDELDAVSGGSPIIPAIIVAELFGLGFLVGMIAHDVKYGSFDDFRWR